jgi:hypothetical protein
MSLDSEILLILLFESSVNTALAVEGVEVIDVLLGRSEVAGEIADLLQILPLEAVELDTASQ